MNQSFTITYYHLVYIILLVPWTTTWYGRLSNHYHPTSAKTSGTRKMCSERWWLALRAEKRSGADASRRQMMPSVGGSRFTTNKNLITSWYSRRFLYKGCLRGAMPTLPTVVQESFYFLIFYSSLAPLIFSAVVIKTAHKVSVRISSSDRSIVFSPS